MPAPDGPKTAVTWALSAASSSSGEGRERQPEAFERKRHAFVRRFNQTSERKMAPNASAAETARRPYARPSRPVCTSL